MRFVDSLNSVHSNVWAVVILLAGVFLLGCGRPAAAAAGSSLVTGAFAMLRTTPDQRAAGTEKQP